SGGPACYRMTLRKAAREAGLAKDRADRISDYDFRHGRVTHLVEKTGNILGAGYLAGHKHATTTNTYLHARSNMAKSVLAMVAGSDAADPHLVAISDDESAAHDLVQTLSATPDDEPKTAAEPRTPSQYRRTHRSAGSAPRTSIAQPIEIASVRGTGLEPAHLAVPEPKSVGLRTTSAIEPPRRPCARAAF
ncbi:MAG: tyrosine-type recombinase/integrase, partial [Polyangiales bacterium]